MPKILKPTKEDIALEKLIAEKPILPNVPPERVKELAVKKNRDRFLKFPNRLPTYDLMPLPPDEHELIGNFESKQNIYLLLAHAYNNLVSRVEELEKKL